MTNLKPPDGALYVVRWQSDKGDIKHRYFRRHHDAQRYADKLQSYGKTPGVYQSETAWRRVTS
ncbi:hypothetical protein F4561_006583 [Lipingzhangella halophila]|uniref:Uncharacterized protein n=1 Tax=Lipingzhangella halophila TaxID=1783352 RepID=A0A7W7RPA9_9ACTN|nr:hypothetical protein [Lipingzhangella halophila]MBB4935674.1 hypothetical protein [Lipingzhangella halophila]